MARYEHLPIYKQALDVAVHCEKVVAGFSRYHKYTLGTELRGKSREIVALIVKANAAPDKRPHLVHLREALDELLILMRIAKEARLQELQVLSIRHRTGDVGLQTERGGLRSTQPG